MRRTSAICAVPQGKFSVSHILYHNGWKLEPWNDQLQPLHFRWAMSMEPRVPRTYEHAAKLRYRLADDRIASHIWCPSYFVAPLDWPSATQEAFGLEEPPTPYEVACILPVIARNSSGVDPCSWSIFWWWLVGFTGFEMFNIDPEPHVASAISMLMQQPMFAVWALGTDLTPVGTNVKNQAIANAIMEGRPYSREVAQEYLQYFVNHPWIQVQLKTGYRNLPIERALSAPDYVFKDLAAKLAVYPHSLETPWPK